MNLSVRKRVGSIVVFLEGSGEIFKEIVKEISFFKKADPALKPDIVYRFLREAPRSKVEASKQEIKNDFINTAGFHPCKSFPQKVG